MTEVDYVMSKMKHISSLELLVHQHLTIQKAGKLTPGSRYELKKKVLEDNEVLFAWLIASVELVDKTSTILLK